MLYSTTSSFTVDQINNIINYRKILSKNIEKFSASIKQSNNEVKRDIGYIIKYWKKREKCCTLLLAYIHALYPYNMQFRGFPKELESEIEIIAILCENEIGI